MNSNQHDAKDTANVGPTRKPRFQIVVEDLIVPDSRSSMNRLRMILKQLLRNHRFQCNDIRELE